MMKKRALALLLALLILALSACQSGKPSTDGENGNDTNVTDPSAGNGNNGTETPPPSDENGNGGTETPPPSDENGNNGTDTPAPPKPEDPGPAAAGPSIKAEPVDLASAEMKKAGSTLTLDKLSVEGAEWKALNDALQALNGEMEEKVKGFRDAGVWDGDGWVVRYEAQVRRADQEVVSVYYTIYEEVGGEPYTRSEAVNFEAKSGRRLVELEDLPGLSVQYDWGTSLNREIYAAISWELGQAADRYMLDRGAFPLADSYQKTMMECLWGLGRYQKPVWTVEKDGIRFVFQLGDIAPWEAGLPQVTVDYDYSTGKLGEKYYPDQDTLLKTMAGEWVQVAGEIEGDVWFCASEGSRRTLTITPDGKASMADQYRIDGQWRTDDPMEMTLTIADHGFWDGFPALNCLEYCAWHTEDYDVNYSFALDGDRLYVWYEHTGEYIATVGCYCRADDPDRLFPRCLEGNWVVHEVESGELHEFPGEDSPWYAELEFRPEAWEDAVPRMYYEFGSRGQWEVTPDLDDQPLDGSSGACWSLSFVQAEENGGGTFAFRVAMDSEEVLRVEESYYAAPDAEPQVTVYTFWRS